MIGVGASTVQRIKAAMAVVHQQSTKVAKAMRAAPAKRMGQLGQDKRT
jgi:hypothetical protein